MIEMPVPELAIKQFQRMFEAAANGGTLHCIEETSGSKIFYVRQALGADKLSRVLFGKPGKSSSDEAAPVFRMRVVDSTARSHVDVQLPALLSSPSSQGLKQRAQG